MAKVFSGPETIFSAIYLIPVSFLTWFLSARTGLLSALASALALLLINLADRPYYAHRAIPYWNTGMDLGVFLFAVFTLTEAKSLYIRERELSREDPLTGIGNRRAFLEALTNEAARARRYLRPLTVVYLDLDDFKQVNDTYGHAAGDAVLAAVGQTIQESIREVDAAARLGGDEFALILPETDTEATRLVVQKVQANVRAALAGALGTVSFGIGAATFRIPPASAEQMIEAADGLMYTAKQAGKNRFAHEVLE
jgi:diguanylate cyclase (GGDEF)-like protein